MLSVKSNIGFKTLQVKLYNKVTLLNYSSSHNTHWALISYLSLHLRTFSSKSTQKVLRVELVE